MGGQFMFSITDLVRVPSDIPAGLYALSHRYDCEQTTQARADAEKGPSF